MKRTFWTFSLALFANFQVKLFSALLQLASHRAPSASRYEISKLREDRQLYFLCCAEALFLEKRPCYGASGVKCSTRILLIMNCCGNARGGNGIEQSHGIEGCSSYLWPSSLERGKRRKKKMANLAIIAEKQRNQ